MENLQNELHDRAERVAATREALFTAMDDYIVYQSMLNNRKAEILLSGSIDGKNAETRDAQLLQQAKPETEKLLQFERELKRTQASFEIEQYFLDAIKYRIRLIEAMKP